MTRVAALVAITCTTLGGVASAAPGPGRGFDLGLHLENQIRAHSEPVFGIQDPIPASSAASITAAVAEADPTALATFAKNLRARVVSAARNLGANIDMMVLFPSDTGATHIIACNEQGVAQPGVQRIRLSDGFVETILTGTANCDPVRRTPWGTVIVGEEAGPGGQLIEIIRPLETTNVVFDRVSGTSRNGPGGTGAENVAARRAVGRLSFEGIALYPNGVMYYGDELRPQGGNPGGSYYKFVPGILWQGGPSITSLEQSPLVAGRVFGLRLGRRTPTDNGQGNNTGLGTWVEIANANNADLGAAARTLGLTGYYRPEDIDIDGGALAAGQVRFCGNNTGNEGDDRNWGETVCFTDGTVAQSPINGAIPEVQFLVVGYNDFAMMDNIAWQPGRGTWIIHEDGDGPAVGRNNDLWSCAEDGADADTLSDGCIRIATLNDLNAEWTGGFFDEAGRRFFVSIQHNVTGHGVILEVTGWR